MRQCAVLRSAPLGFLPLTHNLSRNIAIDTFRSESPCCPACSAPLETNGHFLLCTAPSRLQWRQKFLAALERELTRLYTSPMMIPYLKETIDRLLDGKTISCTGTFHEIAASQNWIGWIRLLLAATFQQRIGLRWSHMSSHAVKGCHLTMKNFVDGGTIKCLGNFD
jgi:hypothetical protein